MEVNKNISYSNETEVYFYLILKSLWKQIHGDIRNQNILTSCFSILHMEELLPCGPKCCLNSTHWSIFWPTRRRKWSGQKKEGWGVCCFVTLKTELALNFYSKAQRNSVWKCLKASAWPHVANPTPRKAEGTQERCSLQLLLMPTLFLTQSTPLWG